MEQIKLRKKYGNRTGMKIDLKELERKAAGTLVFNLRLKVRTESQNSRN